jgi:hypothetical protein
MLKKALVVIALCSVTAGMAHAQARKERLPKPLASEATQDTLDMTCSQAVKLVLSKPQGIVLRTGPNRWDKYVHDAEACGPVQRELIPEFVRTKDARSCHIGYTCSEVDVGE